MRPVPTARAVDPDSSARWGALAHVLAWQVLHSAPADGPTNMAIDAALLDLARETGIATLRIYGWNKPTLSFGRHERTRGRFAVARLEAAGVAAVRRPTGGRALLHDREVTYAVAAPAGSAALRARYDAVNLMIGRALDALGVRATLAASRSRMRPDGAACFAEPNLGELVVGERKLVASAQVEEGAAFLQHGSILLEDDQARIATLGLTPAALRTEAVGLNRLLGRSVEPNHVAEALRTALEELLAPSLASGAVTFRPLATSIPQESKRIAAHRDRFADPAWTWSR